MLTELNGKGGRVCELAGKGEIRCPLIVRPTSEDVVTGNLFGVLSVLNPRWWVPDLLNRALSASRFDRQVFRRFEVVLWESRPRYPGHLLPWEEGSTEVDVALRWENPPTTVYIEMKYGSDVSAKTSGDNGRHGYSSDQLVRNARVGLHECGYLRTRSLFPRPPRDFVLLLVSPRPNHPLVRRYRDTNRLLSAIPKNDQLQQLPPEPFIGECTYRGLRTILAEQRRWFTRTEQRLIDRLLNYLAWKEHRVPSCDFNGRHR